MIPSMKQSGLFITVRTGGKGMCFALPCSSHVLYVWRKYIISVQYRQCRSRPISEVNITSESRSGRYIPATRIVGQRAAGDKPCLQKGHRFCPSVSLFSVIVPARWRSTVGAAQPTVTYAYQIRYKSVACSAFTSNAFNTATSMCFETCQRV